MRILLFTNNFPSPWQPTRGTFNFELARALAASHELRVVAPVSWVDEYRAASTRSATVVRRTERRNGMTVYYPRYYYTPKVGRRWYHEFLWRSVRLTLRRDLSGFRPEAVLGYWTHPDGTVAVRYAREIDARAFVMVGGSDLLLSTPGSVRRRLVCRTLNAADGVIPVSKDLERHVLTCGVPPDRVHVVYRGVDRGRFFPGDRVEARSKLGLATDIPVFLWVGRMVPVKGVDVLLQAVARVQRLTNRFALALVGDGPERRRLEQLGAMLGLGEVVRWIGSVSHGDLPDWYRAADWCILSSHSEGVPNVLIEARACGTPFVAPGVGGVDELAIAGVDRVVVPDDPIALAKNVTDCLVHPAVNRDWLAAQATDVAIAAQRVAALLAAP
jgi:glycosyltransferase involved in cell wall biosynthesis